MRRVDQQLKVWGEREKKLRHEIVELVIEANRLGYNVTETKCERKEHSGRSMLSESNENLKRIRLDIEDHEQEIERLKAMINDSTTHDITCHQKQH